MSCGEFRSDVPFAATRAVEGGGCVVATVAAAAVAAAAVHPLSLLPQPLDAVFVIPAVVPRCSLFRSHRGHELLRHSPLGKNGGGGGARPARQWGDVAPADGGGGSVDDASPDGITNDGDGAGAVGAGAANADGEAAGATAAPGFAGGGGASAADPRRGDIEREVRQQGGLGEGGGGGGAGGGDAGLGGGKEESLAVSQARTLLSQGLISQEELDAVVRKDQVSEKLQPGMSCLSVRDALRHKQPAAGFPPVPGCSPSPSRVVVSREGCVLCRRSRGGGK